MLGWTESQLDSSTIEYIETAYRGRVKFVKDIVHYIYGSPDGDAPQPNVNQRQFDLGVFDALFGGDSK